MTEEEKESKSNKEIIVFFQDLTYCTRVPILHVKCKYLDFYRICIWICANTENSCLRRILTKENLACGAFSFIKPNHDK